LGLLWSDLVYTFALPLTTASMTATKEVSDTYATTVRVSRDVQHALKAEQARRLLDGKKEPTLAELASELLTKAALALAEEKNLPTLV
jgi:hypothetical protein